MAARSRRVVASLLVVGFSTSTAHAQSSAASALPVTPSGVPMTGPMLGPPQVTWLFTQGDANGGRGDALGPSSLLFEPIRLALLGSLLPANGPCGELESIGSATAAAPGFAMQHAAALTLTPRLTLFGFARGGCQLDAGYGGALVYAVPIAKNVTLAASMGIFQLPHAGPHTGATTTAQARVDLVFQRPKGRSLSVGIGTRGFTFGGTL